jgi:hypothetical protein
MKTNIAMVFLVLKLKNIENESQTFPLRVRAECLLMKNMKMRDFVLGSCSKNFSQGESSSTLSLAKKDSKLCGDSR